MIWTLRAIIIVQLLSLCLLPANSSLRFYTIVYFYIRITRGAHRSQIDERDRRDPRFIHKYCFAIALRALPRMNLSSDFTAGITARYTALAHINFSSPQQRSALPPAWPPQSSLHMRRWDDTRNRKRLLANASHADNADCIRRRSGARWKMRGIIKSEETGRIGSTGFASHRGRGSMIACDLCHLAARIYPPQSLRRV